MNRPKTRIENIVVQEMEKEILIYDLTINKAYCLNETSAMVYQLCDGTRSIAEISQQLSKQLNQMFTEDLVWLALDGFGKDNLLDENEQFAVNFDGLNRRQIVKKIGFASMIALPVIASMVAPGAVTAQSSGRALLATCSNPSQCASGNCSTATFPNVCCVAGSVGLIGANFCCSDPPSCNQACCSGSGTIIDPGACPTIGFPLRVRC